MTAVSPDGRLLALCPAGAAPQVCDTVRHRRLAGDRDKADPAVCGTGSGADSGSHLLRFGANGRWLTVAYGTAATVWDVRSGRTVVDFASGGVSGFTRLALSPDGRFPATSDDQQIVVWRLDNGGTLAYQRPLSGAEVWGLAWDPGKRRVLRILDGATVRRYDLTDRLAARWRDTEADATALSPDGTSLATVVRSGGGYRFELWSPSPTPGFARAGRPPWAGWSAGPSSALCPHRAARRARCCPSVRTAGRSPSPTPSPRKAPCGCGSPCGTCRRTGCARPSTPPAPPTIPWPVSPRAPGVPL